MRTVAPPDAGLVNFRSPASYEASRVPDYSVGNIGAIHEIPSIDHTLWFK